MKLTNSHMHNNVRKHLFRNRIVAIWNSLSNTVVSAKSTNTFKPRLGKFYAHQDFKFDWNADVAGIGSRSINS